MGMLLNKETAILALRHYQSPDVGSGEYVLEFLRTAARELPASKYAAPSETIDEAARRGFEDKA